MVGTHTPPWGKDNHLTPYAVVRTGGYAFVLIPGINTYSTKEQAKRRALSYTNKTDFRSKVFKMGNGKWGVYATD